MTFRVLAQGGGGGTTSRYSVTEHFLRLIQTTYGVRRLGLFYIRVRGVSARTRVFVVLRRRIHRLRAAGVALERRALTCFLRFTAKGFGAFL